ncbi:MAG TPA: hypothetical protein VGZ25_08595 [Gemmataceae bacterium]|nr:hypothetical protein [Gemmataceae bacterium]
MTTDEFDTAYRAFCRRRPFRAFLIEFNSGSPIQIGHPEAVRNEGVLYAMRCPDGRHVVFAAESVCRFLDPPKPPTLE